MKLEPGFYLLAVDVKKFDLVRVREVNDRMAIATVDFLYENGKYLGNQTMRIENLMKVINTTQQISLDDAEFAVARAIEVTEKNIRVFLH